MFRARNLFHALLLWFGLISSSSQELSALFPRHNTSRHHGEVPLYWTFNATNVLLNGSFEQGLEGWTTNGTFLLARTTQPGHGTNRLDGYGVISRTLQLPDSSAMLFSFAGPSTASLRLLSPEHELLFDSSTSPHEPSTGWPMHLYDLSPFRGRLVQIQIVLAYGEAIPRLDNLQLLVGPPDVQYDLYLRDSGLTRYLGRTNAFSWPSPRLLPNTNYTWRVDAVTPSGTNVGPNWTFSTMLPTLITADRLAFDGVPDAACLNSPIPLLAFFTHEGFASRQSKSVTLSAHAQNVKPASVIISEVDTGPEDAVEVINASDNPVSMASWTVQFFQHADVTTPSITHRFGSGTLQPGQIMTIRESGQPGSLPTWPHHRLTRTLNWGEVSSTHVVAGVTIRDNLGNLIDCVFIDTRAAHGRRYPIFIPMLDWNSEPIVAATMADQAYARAGNVDLNQSTDWHPTARSIGAPNEHLFLPFRPGFGSVAISPTSVTNWVKGPGTNRFSFTQPASNVVIYSPQVNGKSYPFDLVDTAHCATLTGPVSISENAGTASFRLMLASPTTEPLTLHLTSSDPRRLPVPQTLLFPAGSAQLNIDLSIPDDTLLQGNSDISLVAELPGYATASLGFTFLDDEKGIITITGPDRIRENDSQPVLIEMHPVPAMDFWLNLRFQPQLGFQDRTFVWRAGQSQVGLLVGADEHFVGPPLSQVRLEASNGDWVPGTLDFMYEDNDPPLLSVFRGPQPGQITIRLSTIPGWSYQLFSLPLDRTPTTWLQGETQKASENHVEFTVPVDSHSTLFRVECIP